ncbi:OPT protein, partial [Myiagra hebetior]|nr:OPT protein [Myiagra hebetior]
RMGALGWLAVASLCLGTLWAIPAQERRKAEKPKADLTLYENLDLDNYDLTLDNYGEILDLSNYEELYDYGDLAPKIEVGTLAPRPKDPKNLPDPGETTAGTPKLQPPSPAGPVPAAPIPGQGLPSCLLCLCLGTSVYCDDSELEQIPALPPDTAFLYARFNRIGAVRAADFRGLENLQRIDLSSNRISRADADAFRLLPRLQELLLPQNRLTALPELPRSLVRLDARLNRIPSAGLSPEAFRHIPPAPPSPPSPRPPHPPCPCPCPRPRPPPPPPPHPSDSLLSRPSQNNNIQTMHEDTFCDSQDQGQIRRELEDVRLDGNPINLSLFPNAFFCLPRLPTGRF